MNKQAYDMGVLRALQDAGIAKEAMRFSPGEYARQIAERVGLRGPIVPHGVTKLPPVLDWRYQNWMDDLHRLAAGNAPSLGERVGRWFTGEGKWLADRMPKG